MELSIKNKHEYDDRIKFQKEGHVYWIDNDSKDLISATSYIKQFFSEFNTEQVIQKIMNKYEYSNVPTYKYYKMKPEIIKKQWNSKK